MLTASTVRRIGAVPVCSRIIWTAALAVTSGLAATASADILPLDFGTHVVEGHQGAAIAIIGDVDFDGYDDVLVGAPGYAVNGFDKAGVILIYSGKTGLPIRFDWSPTPTANGAFGAAVIVLPDINGDGRRDYAVGAPGEMGGQGRVRVYSGATGNVIWTATGSLGTSGFGGCLAVVPDASGNGIVQLAVGSGGPALDQESVRVYHAHNGILWRVLNKPANAGNSIAFGHAIGGVPDVNGDGLGDVIIGAPKKDAGQMISRGTAWIYDGATGAPIMELETPMPAYLGRFGFAVAGIADLDGDGRGEVIIGAPGEALPGQSGNPGRARIYSGATGAVLTELVPQAQWSWGRFGHAIAVAHNLDDDGVPDIVISAPNSGGDGSGWIYRFSGATGAEIGSVISPYLNEKGNGEALSASGDCTQSGRADIAVGAPRTMLDGVAEAGFASLVRLVPNDGCGPANPPIPLTQTWNYFSNVGATNYTAIPGGCDGTPNELLQSDVHFTYTAPGTGVVTFSICGTTFDPWLALYGHCEFTQFACAFGTPDACSDNAPGCGTAGPRAAIAVTAGQCVRVRVGGVGASQGIGALIVEFTPGNDTCDADLNADGVVDGADLGVLLANWGGVGVGDLDGDGTVNGADLGLLLQAWGNCG